MPHTIHLVDASPYIFRAFFSIPDKPAFIRAEVMEEAARIDRLVASGAMVHQART